MVTHLLRQLRGESGVARSGGAKHPDFQRLSAARCNFLHCLTPR
jgi:hypothetical protein